MDYKLNELLTMAFDLIKKRDKNCYDKLIEDIRSIYNQNYVYEIAREADLAEILHDNKELTKVIIAIAIGSSSRLLKDYIDNSDI